MRYIIFIFCVFSNVALGCNNTYLDVNNTEGISAKICPEDNDSLSVSVLGNGKILSAEDIDVSSEKKTILFSKIIIVIIIRTSVYGM